MKDILAPAWTKRELGILARHSTPEKIQDLLDSIPYRCENGHFCARVMQLSPSWQRSPMLRSLMYHTGGAYDRLMAVSLGLSSWELT